MLKVFPAICVLQFLLYVCLKVHCANIQNDGALLSDGQLYSGSVRQNPSIPRTRSEEVNTDVFDLSRTMINRASQGRQRRRSGDGDILMTSIVSQKGNTFPVGCDSFTRPLQEGRSDNKRSGYAFTTMVTPDPENAPERCERDRRLSSMGGILSFVSEASAAKEPGTQAEP